MQIWSEQNVRSTETRAVGEIHQLAILNGGWLHLTDALPISQIRLLEHLLVMHISIFSTVGRGKLTSKNYIDQMIKMRLKPTEYKDTKPKKGQSNVCK